MKMKKRSFFQITSMFFGLCLIIFYGIPGLAAPGASLGEKTPARSATRSADHLVTSFYTYLGGSDHDEVQDMAIGSDGSIYIVGGTNSSDMPIVNGYQSTFGGDRDVFLAKFSADGMQLLFSTYLGGPGDDYAMAVELDAAGNIVIAGQAGSNFPVVNGYQGTMGGGMADGFVAKFSPDGSNLLYSSYIGGAGWDSIIDMKLKSTGGICVVGFTQSPDYPVINAFKDTYEAEEAFVTEFSADGSALVFSTFLGGTRNDFAHGLAIDGSDNLYVTGWTSSYDFPTVNPYQATKSGDQYNEEVFVTKISPDGSTLLYSTYLGGSSGEYAYDIAVDSSGAAYVVGNVWSSDFPTTAGSYQPVKSEDNNYYSESFISKLSPSGDTLVYSTFLGGSYGHGELTRVVPVTGGAVYVTGYTSSENYPLLNPVNEWQTPGGVNLARLSADGSTLEYSTCLNQSGGNGFALAVDSGGSVYVGGMEGTSYCGYEGYQMTNNGMSDMFAAKLMPTSTDRITIIAPNGFEEWEVGSTQTITWTAPETLKNVRIEVIHGGGFEVIADSAPNTGSYTWVVTDYPSTMCRMMVMDAAPGGWLGTESENYFTISPLMIPWIELTAPNGGQWFQAFSTQTITWIDNGLVPDVAIDYSIDNGSTWIPVETSIPNQGFYQWTVPNTASTECRVRVGEPGFAGAWDPSDGTFEIAPAVLVQEERDALIALYNSTNGDNWTNNGNWRHPSDPTRFNDPGTEHTWYGVTLNADNTHVTRIQMMNNNLVGTLPDMGMMSECFYFRVPINQLSGPIPTWFNQLTQLKEFDLGWNQFSGPIPDLSNLTNMTLLDLQHNQLTGYIPEWLNSLTDLGIIKLGENQFSGYIPFLGDLTSLRWLVLNENNLGGQIPEWINTLPTITLLQLNDNQFTGIIPNLSGLSGLTFISLSNNQLTGPVPSWLNNLPLSSGLLLDGNQLSGPIPDLGNLTNLGKLYLGNNQLTGPVPAWINNMTLMRELDLSDNLLTGDIPAINNMVTLTKFDLSGNQLTGPVPQELGTFPGLKFIYLGNNQLDGTIPANLGNLPDLRHLYLNDNRLSGTIPAELGNCNWMIYLHLQGNQFSGPMPSSLINLINLYSDSLNISYNRLYTDDPALRDFLNSKHGGTLWEDTQTVAPTGLSTGTVAHYSVELAWTPVLYGGDGGGYRVYVSTASGSGYTLAGTTADKNASSFTVTGLTPSTAYYFVVETFTPSHADNQNQLVSELTPEMAVTTSALPTVTVTAPNGGERWKSGTVQTITWNTTGYVTDVNLYYSYDGGTNYTSIGPSANTGTYNWTIPDLGKTNHNCLVKIVTNDNSAEDTGNGVFSIKK